MKTEWDLFSLFLFQLYLLECLVSVNEQSPDSTSMSELPLGLRRVLLLGFGDKTFSWGLLLQVIPGCQQEAKISIWIFKQL